MQRFDRQIQKALGIYIEVLLLVNIVQQLALIQIHYLLPNTRALGRLFQILLLP